MLRDGQQKYDRVAQNLASTRIIERICSGNQRCSILAFERKVAVSIGSLTPPKHPQAEAADMPVVTSYGFAVWHCIVALHCGIALCLSFAAVALGATWLSEVF